MLNPKISICMKQLVFVLVATCYMTSAAIAQTVTADPLNIGGAGTFTSFASQDVILSVNDDFAVRLVDASSSTFTVTGGPFLLNTAGTPNSGSQLLVKPTGTRNNIGHVETGGYGVLNGTAKWLGLGTTLPGTGATAYGFYSRWFNHVGAFGLRQVSPTVRDLVIKWGGTSSNNRLRFEYADVGAGLAETVAVFDSNGDFGIGNVNPDAPLHVGNTNGLNSRIRLGSLEYIEDGGSNTIKVGASLVPVSTSWDLGNTTSNWDNVYAQDFITVSDRRAKNSIADNAYGLAEIMKLHPVTFVYTNDKRGKRKVGLIAQEVNEVISEVVSDPSQERITGESGEALHAPDDARMGINYSDLVPVLITAMQEQQAQITALQEQLEALQSKVEASGVEASGTLQEQQPDRDLSPQLLQNYPNPADGSTRIAYRVPEGSNAQIVIYDLEGKLVQRITIIKPGEGSIALSSGSLAPGVYVYSLLVDDHKVASENMVINQP